MEGWFQCRLRGRFIGKLRGMCRNSCCCFCFRGRFSRKALFFAPCVFGQSAKWYLESKPTFTRKSWKARLGQHCRRVDWWTNAAGSTQIEIRLFSSLPWQMRHGEKSGRVDSDNNKFCFIWVDPVRCVSETTLARSTLKKTTVVDPARFVQEPCEQQRRMVDSNDAAATGPHQKKVIESTMRRWCQHGSVKTAQGL